MPSNRVFVVAQTKKQLISNRNQSRITAVFHCIPLLHLFLQNVGHFSFAVMVITSTSIVSFNWTAFNNNVIRRERQILIIQYKWYVINYNSIYDTHNALTKNNKKKRKSSQEKVPVFDRTSFIVWKKWEVFFLSEEESECRHAMMSLLRFMHFHGNIQKQIQSARCLERKNRKMCVFFSTEERIRDMWWMRTLHSEWET